MKRVKALRKLIGSSLAMIMVAISVLSVKAAPDSQITLSAQQDAVITARGGTTDVAFKLSKAGDNMKSLTMLLSWDPAQGEFDYIESLNVISPASAVLDASGTDLANGKLIVATNPMDPGYTENEFKVHFKNVIPIGEETEFRVKGEVTVLSDSTGFDSSWKEGIIGNGSEALATYVGKLEIVDNQGKPDDGIITIYPYLDGASYTLELTLDGTALTAEQLAEIEWEVEGIAGFEAHGASIVATKGSNIIQAEKSGITQLRAKYKDLTATIDVVTPGDANRDGDLDNSDASAIFSAGLGTVQLPASLDDEYTPYLLDLNRDGTIDNADASSAFTLAMGIVAYK